MKENFFRSHLSCSAVAVALFAASAHAADTKSEVKNQHAAIGAAASKNIYHNTNSGAQWFPQAGFGLFLHWGIAAVHDGSEAVGDLSWAMQTKGLMNMAKYWMRSYGVVLCLAKKHFAVAETTALPGPKKIVDGTANS